MSDKVQPETSAKCPLRDRWAKALHDEWCGPECPRRDCAKRPDNSELDALSAVRDDVLAEAEWMRDHYERCFIEANDSAAESLRGMRSAETREARLREAVGAIRAEMVGLQGAGVPLVARSWVVRKLDAALAPREPATEAPRTRDGEQECTGASGCCTACNGTGGGEIGGSCWDCRGTGHPHPPLDGDGERCGSGTPPVSVPDIAAPSVAANDDEQGEWGDDDLPTPDEALRMGWTV